MDYEHKLEFVIILYLLSLSLFITAFFIFFFNTIFSSLNITLKFQWQLLTFLFLLISSVAIFSYADTKKKKILISSLN